MSLIHKIVNRLLKYFQIRTLPTKDKVVYLTFDDGPEPGICEFVLEELERYGFKGTFFCSGKNAEEHPQLMQLLLEKGHSLGNHSYSHTYHPYTSSDADYVQDVLRADAVLHTPLFRPPWGSLSLGKFIRLCPSFTFYSWSLESDDHVLREEGFDWEAHVQRMTEQTRPGDIALFHFAIPLQQGTRHLLPPYLKWLAENGWRSEALPSR